MALSKINTNSIATVSNVNTGNVIFTDGSTLSSGWTGFKNRVINGAITVDQRASTQTVNADAVFYSTDRWIASGVGSSGVYTIAQSSSAPTGFSKSLLVTVTTTDSSLSSTDVYAIQTRLEGYSIADLAYGTSSALTTTLSFWVKSSVTGTFGGGIRNGSYDRGYAYTYVINSANTWEYKTVTIPGCPNGTWDTTNGHGMTIAFGLGVGSNEAPTAGSWTSGASVRGAAGTTNLMATNGATWQITGVQLERGSSASSFEWRPYTTELALCQRYFVKLQLLVLPAAYYTYRSHFFGRVFPVTMRTTPSITVYSSQTNTINKISGYSTGTEYTVNELNIWNGDTISYVGTSSAISNQEPQGGTFWCSAEL